LPWIGPPGLAARSISSCSSVALSSSCTCCTTTAAMRCCSWCCISRASGRRHVTMSTATKAADKEITSANWPTSSQRIESVRGAFMRPRC